jgi:hypothetical protein
VIAVDLDSSSNAQLRKTVSSMQSGEIVAVCAEFVASPPDIPDSPALVDTTAVSLCDVVESGSNATAPSTVEAEAPSTIEPEALSTVEAEAPSTIEPEALSTVEAEAPSTIEPEALSTVEAEAPSTIEPEAFSTVEAEAPSTIEPEAPSTVEAEAPSTIEPEVAASGSPPLSPCMPESTPTTNSAGETPFPPVIDSIVPSAAVIRKDSTTTLKSVFPSVAAGFSSEPESESIEDRSSPAPSPPPEGIKAVARSVIVPVDKSSVIAGQEAFAFDDKFKEEESLKSAQKSREASPGKQYYSMFGCM